MAEHDAHDPLLIAALVDRDVTEDEAEAARVVVASCPECAALHDDLVALAGVVRDLPTPARPRDFRLRPVDAHRLRPSRWRRLLAAFGTSPETVGRPLGGALATIGLAGVLLGSASAVLPAGAGGAAGTTLAVPAPAATREPIELQGAREEGFEEPDEDVSALDASAPGPAINVPLVGGSAVLVFVGLLGVALSTRRSAGRGNRAPPSTV